MPSSWLFGNGCQRRKSYPRPMALAHVFKVERALILVCNYCITIDTVAVDCSTPRKKGFTLKAQKNPCTGKSSTRALAFSEPAWGAATRGYSMNAKKSIKNAQKLKLIVTAAKSFEKVTQRTGSSNATSAEVKLQEEERAFLGDADDSEEE